MNNFKKTPNHVAIIMDGNGRWAEKKGLPRVKGHPAGVEKGKDVINYCVKSKIEYLSLFAFSSENAKRPKDEVETLMSIFLSVLQDDLLEMYRKDISLNFIGDLSYFPPPLVEAMRHAEKITKDNKALKLVIAVNYGGKWDLLQAMKKVFAKVSRGDVEIDNVDEDLLGSHLSTDGIPEPDLFIRTSGEKRISNFYLWQLAYTELYFSPILWPDFTIKDFEQALAFYAERNRRFGMTSEQATTLGNKNVV